MSQYQKTYDPDFVITVAGVDVTKFVMRWILEDVEDGISSLTVTLANPDGRFSGQFQTETDMSIRFGYHQGPMSPTITMKIKDKTETYPTTKGPTITLVALDCTERLVGITSAGNSIPNPQLKELIESLLKGADIRPQVEIKEPEEKPERIPLHNMTSHAGIRWLMSHTICDKPKRGAWAPILGQKEYNAGPSFPSADSVSGDRSNDPTLDQKLQEIPKFRAINRKTRAGTTTITATLDLIGQPTLRAKGCVTILNVGPEASGRWYIKKLTQTWDVNHGYITHCSLLRPTLGPDGKALEQPVVMYADIYKKDTVYVGCRKIDSPSQATFTYGTGEYVMSFKWQTRLQRGRAAGEKIKMMGIRINNFGRTIENEAQKDGSYTPKPPSPNITEWGDAGY